MIEKRKEFPQMKMIIDFGDGVFREYFIHSKINANVHRGDEIMLRFRHPQFSEQMLVTTQKYEEYPEP